MTTQLKHTTMKLSIELTATEVKGIKAYLKDVDGIEKPTKEDIRTFLQGIVNGVLQSSAESVANYIAEAG